ncbi:MAG: glycosyltransferase family 1 protein [Bacteroidales bacterium]|nr:glycosyltransferase family 1 protein [Bacteroidales bacterium]
MRIAFDGKKAAKNKAGLGNYSRFIIRCMAERYPDCQFDVYVGANKDSVLLSSLKRLPNVNICRPTHPLLKYSYTLWSLFGIPYELKKRKTDIYHGLSNELPWNIARAGDTGSVVTIHDLIFLTFPHTYSWADRHIYNIKFRKACRIADRIISVSRFTATEIVKHYFTPKEKISLAYQGCDWSFREKCSKGFKDLVRERYSLPSSYILSVGTIEERKNTALLVKALQHIDNIDVVLVGKRTRYTEYVERTAAECGVSDRVHILSGVDFKELPAVYQMASAFVYPSRIEGFGIPVLEALCSGIPVIAASGSCLEEAGGDAALYVDPDDDRQLAEYLKTVLADENMRRDMVAKGYAQVERFTDASLAEKIMSIYEDVIARRRQGQTR